MRFYPLLLEKLHNRLEFRFDLGNIYLNDLARAGSGRPEIRHI